MIRSTLALSSVLLGSLLASPLAIGQEVPKQVPPPPESAGQAAQALEAAAKAVIANEQVVAEIDQLVDQRQITARKTLQNWFINQQNDALEANFGLSLSDADETLRAQLEIPAGEGVVVVGVKPGSLAEQAGLKLNDILLSLGDQKAKSSGQAKQILLGLGKEALGVKLIREGKARRMSLVGPEHGFPPEAAEFWIGTPVSPVDAILRTHLPTLSADTGLVVNDVVKGSPADQAAVKKDDILVAMDGKPMKSTDVLIAQIQASQGKPVPLQVLRSGQPLTITITPAKRAHPTVINARKDDQQLLYRLVQPNMAIELKPGATGGQTGDKPAPSSKVESKPTVTGYVGLVPYAVPQPYSVNLPTYAYQIATKPELQTERIEGQLKEVMAKLEEISKSLEALKKPIVK